MDRMNHLKALIREKNSGVGERFGLTYVSSDRNLYNDDLECIKRLEKEGYIKIIDCKIDVQFKLDIVYLKEL